MIKKLNKRGFAGFGPINAGMISFIAFVLVVTLVILFIATLQSTAVVCDGSSVDGTCYVCPSGYSLNSTSKYCCNGTTTAGTPVSTKNCSASQMNVALESDSAAWNGTKNLQKAADLPPQFAEIIVITIVIIGILGLLALAGLGVYKKLN